jgi:GNAT superfamily N-acetyltransferase
MILRPYEDADFADLVALWQACGIDAPGNDPAKDIPYIRDSPQARLFVGHVDNELMASAMAGDDGHRGWLYYVAVHPRHRRRGHGRALVRRAEAWMRERGLLKSNLLIRDGNRAVAEFYARLGYGAQARLVMQRRLDNGAADPPPPTIEVAITRLEMTAAPTRPTVPAPPGRLALLKLEQPSVGFYRYLYASVGEPWLWWERRRMDDDTLRALIAHPEIDIYVLYVGGEPAGYAELSRKAMPEINIDCFGLMPTLTGRGYGRYLLNWAVDQAWCHGPRRVTVSTCSLDDPRGLRTYQKAGFVPYAQERRTILDPRASGLIPASAMPRR